MILNQESQDSETVFPTMASTEQKKNNIKRSLGAHSEDGMTSLLNAIDRVHYDVATYLIEQGADIQVRDNNGYDCLLMATRSCDRSNYEILIPMLVSRR